MGIKERRTKILLALFLLSDVKFSYVQLTEKAEKVFDIYLNQKTKGTMANLIKEGYIEKEGQQPLHRLTEKGFYVLVLEFPVFRFLKDSWDGKWRILSYEIPEKKRDIRDKLRREVAGWGLGPWHRSFWLTPHPITSSLNDLIFGREEEKYVQAFEADHVVGDKALLIEKVWQIAALEEDYRRLFKVWHDTLASSLDKDEKLKKVVREYIDVLRHDPGLPRELVGEKFIGFEAFTIFKEIRGILLS